MGANSTALTKQLVARLRRDVRIQAHELMALVDADLDCTVAARELAHAQADLRLYLDKLEQANERKRLAG